MVGSQWSKEELTRFYRGYHKYGKNWRKVAGSIRSKSSEMVEKLYDINKAFLSLPEDQRTADAFIAMMTDRHNILDICDSQQENNDALKKTCKLKKRPCGKSRLGISRDSDRAYYADVQNHSNMSYHGHTTMVKKRNHGDLVGSIKHHPVGKRTPRVPVQYFHDTNDKDAILSPNKEVQRLEASGEQSRRKYNRRSSPVLSFEKKYAESDIADTNFFDVGMAGTYSSGSLKNRESGVKDSVTDAIRLNSEDSGVNESYWNEEFQENRLTSSDCEFEESMDGREACSGIVEGDFFSLDKLHTLAELALGLSTPNATDSESSLHAMEKGRDLDTAEKSSALRSTPTHHVKALSGERNIFSKDLQQNSPFTVKIPRRKRKFLHSEVAAEDRKDSCAGQLVHTSKRPSLEQSVECAFLNRTIGGNNMDQTGLSSPVSSVCMSASTRSRRKTSMAKANVKTELHPSIDAGKERLYNDSISVHSKTDNVKRELSNCLSSEKFRRWCMFEWFYSAIDYPWYAKYEFVNYLKHVRLGHVSRLSRSEWSTIRSSLGKPRRFSRNFLLEERKKLEQYRKSVRACYAELNSGVREGLPSDLAQQFFVGQYVIASDWKAGEIRDGSILTVAESHFKVQFASSDRGVQSVMDVDCMPLDPWKNLPVDLRKQNVVVDDICNDHTDRNHLVNSSELSTSTILNQMKIQAMEYDIKTIAEITTTLEKKEALVTELRHMNEVFIRNSGNMIHDFEQFKKQYAMIVSQLSDIKSQVESGRNYLKERNSHKEGSIAQWFNSSELPTSDALPDNICTSDLGQAVEIVERSKREARTMVASTFLSEEPADAFANMGEALDSTSYQHSGANSWTSQSSCILPNISTTFEGQVIHAPSQQIELSSETKELISDCLATCLMIQNCADGQHPPAVIEETLRRALSSLQPCCPDNLPIYKEIERCLTDIKYEMISRVPTKVAEISV